MNPMPLIYCVDANADEPIMLINKHVGFDPDYVDEETGMFMQGLGMGVDGAAFQQELLYLDSLGKKRIQVWINSVGGVVMDGYNIFTAILKSKTPVDTYAMGGCASIAAVIFLAGRKRYMTDYSWLMYHNPYGGTKQSLDTIKTSIIKMVASKCKMSEKEVEDMMARTSYIKPTEAQRLGLCDEIKTSEQENTKYLRSIDEPKAFIREAGLVLNKIVEKNQVDNKNNNKTMEGLEKVNMHLKLNSSARVEDTLVAIETIQNKADKAEAELRKVQDKAKSEMDEQKEEMDKLKDKIKKLEDDKKKADEELDACKSKLDAMTADKEKAEEEKKTLDAKNKIEEYVKKGVIKNEETTKLRWTNMLKSNFDETIAMLDELPVNKIAPKMETTKIDDPAQATTAAALAARNKLKREGKL